MKLLSQAKLFDDCTITVDVFFLEVVEHVAATTNHLEQTASGVMVVLVCFEVLGQVVDSLGEDCDLYLCGTGVGVMQSVLFDYLSFFFFSHHGYIHLIKIFRR